MSKVIIDFPENKKAEKPSYDLMEMLFKMKAERQALEKLQGKQVNTCTPRTVEDLNFTDLDDNGRMIWWKIITPITNHWSVHYELGKAYAYEFLDLITNKKAKKIDKHTLGYIAVDIFKKSESINDGIIMGFFNTISEYIITGKVDR